jgi:Flp pilus assembly protein TadG
MNLLRNWRIRLSNRAGQALIEFTFVAITLLLLLFGLIDFCRAISIRQVITSLSRESSNLASRNTSLSDTITAIVASANPLNITSNGRIIISVVTNSAGVAIVANQVSWGADTNGVSTVSKVGPGGSNSVANMPSTAPLQIPQANQTVYVTEIYYSYQAVTPVGKFLNFTLPTQLYDAAYF